MKEEWRTVPEWNLYEISNFGRLRGKDRTIRENYRPYLRKGRLLKPNKDRHGYYVFSFKQDGRKKELKIHRLVAMCFIPNPENKPCVNHIDNNPSNNHVTNLEWVTMQENTDWMIKQGRFKRTKQWLDRLHESQSKDYKPIKGINIMTGEKLYFVNLNSVRNMGFLPSSVCNCCKGKRNKHKGYRWEYITKEEYEEQKN